MPCSNGEGTGFEPEFWGTLVDFGSIIWSVFEKDTFWRNCSVPSQAMQRTDAMMEFIDRCGIEKPEPKRVPRISGNILIDGKTFRLGVI
jgi:hypothetical protein